MIQWGEMVFSINGAGGTGYLYGKVGFSIFLTLHTKFDSKWIIEF